MHIYRVLCEHNCTNLPHISVWFLYHLPRTLLFYSPATISPTTRPNFHSGIVKNPGKIESLSKTLRHSATLKYPYLCEFVLKKKHQIYNDVFPGH